MWRSIFTMMVAAGLISGCGTSPKDHTKAAYRLHSLECVARGIPENTPAHTECIVNKYGSAVKERRNNETKMRELFVDSKD